MKIYVKLTKKKKKKKRKKKILPPVKNDQETSLTATGTKMACYMQGQMTVRQFS